MLRPSTYPRSRSPCAMGSKDATPSELDSSDKYPTLGTFVGGCASAARGATSRLKTSMTIHRTVLHHMIVTSCHFRADRFSSRRRTHRSAAGASIASPGPLKRVVGRLLRRRQLRNAKLLPTLLSVPQIVLRLLVEPTLGGRTKGNGKTNRHLGADPGTAIQNGGQGLAAYSQSFCGLRNGEAKWLKAKGLDDLARMRWIVHTHRYSLSDSLRSRRHQHPYRRT